MREDYSRHMVATFTFISLVPLAAINLWVHRGSITGLDWTAFGLLLLAAWTHFDSRSPNPD